MATKALVHIGNIGFVGAGEARVDVSYCSCVASPQIDSGSSYNVTVGAGFLAAVAAAVQADMETAGLSFTTAVDSLRVGTELVLAI